MIKFEFCWKLLRHGCIALPGNLAGLLHACPPSQIAIAVVEASRALAGNVGTGDEANKAEKTELLEMHDCFDPCK